MYKILLITVFLINRLLANECNCYSLYDDTITIKINECKKELSIEKLTLNDDLLGKLDYVLNTPYKLRINKITHEKLYVDTTFYYADDTFEATGIKITTKIFNPKNPKGSAIIDISYEELKLFYNPQQLKVDKDTCK